MGLNNWFNASRRDFFLREARWTVFYLFRTRGALWIPLHTLVLILLDLSTSSIFAKFTGTPEFLVWLSIFLRTIIPMIATAPLWMVLVKKRVYIHFEPGRIQGIATSPIKPSDFWPALLTAPVLATALIWPIASFPSFVARLWHVAMAGFPLPFSKIEWLGQFLLMPAIHWIFIVVASIVYTSAGVFAGLPSRRVTVALLTACLMSVAFALLKVELYRAFESESNSSSHPYQTFLLVVSTLFLIQFAVAWLCVAGMRRPKYWEHLLKGAATC